MWHDRATFHFLLTEEQIKKYLSADSEAIKGNGYMTIGTFSDTGPDKCSGLDIKRYSEKELQNQLESRFNKIRCIHEDHLTPYQYNSKFLILQFQKS